MKCDIDNSELKHEGKTGNGGLDMKIALFLNFSMCPSKVLNNLLISQEIETILVLF